jgi:cobalt/nickel transport system permease protein
MLLPERDLVSVVKTVFASMVFSVIIMLPSVFMGHPRTLLTVLMKVTESVMILSILNTEVDWKNMTGALRAFKVPPIFILTLDLTVKYLVILGRFSDKLLESVMLRSVGKKNWKTSGVGDILGTTFLKSQRIAQHTSEAMECRLFNGTYKSYSRHKWNIWDFIYIVILIAIIVLFVVTQM